MDYSALRGTPPERITAERYVDLRRSALAGLRTQHLSHNHAVTVDGDTATCRCEAVIHRWPADVADARHFHTYGAYTYRLVRQEGRWRVGGIRQVVHRNEGDPTLHGALLPA